MIQVQIDRGFVSQFIHLFLYPFPRPFVLSKGEDRKYPLEYSRKVCLAKKYTLHRPLERKRTNVLKKDLKSA